MQFIPFEEGIEVKGHSVKSVVDGFNTFAVLGSAYLLDEGIGTPAPNGLANLDLEGWYPQRSWLLCFQQIGKQLGDGLLMQVGMAIPRNAVFPEGIEDIHEAIRSIDVAYHMNHRKNGRPMFDPESGRMQEGIGHYGYEPVPGKRKIICLCENPYPCAFDHGLLTAMAQRYQSNARVTHDEAGPCRKQRGDRCTYVVSW
ncbi:hypothetical protein [Vitiosangium sp. GDMCC 1.1324]|uniref:hypothetical protein n=1 Tax=Vitiosangium sp. (strain GDMCC 1.1324) TaxID=2138576 RepID=UPI000D3A0FAB|nr:hypothetical protein [Vitiosangium sp. GDMCC 1.1324]PTL81823.1 hypothetical protein DAT35_23090 [Vitiosangium sp. GDMCC 1.1324]